MDTKTFEVISRDLGYRIGAGGSWASSGGFLFSLQAAGTSPLQLRTAVASADTPAYLRVDSWLTAQQAEGVIAGYRDEGGTYRIDFPVGTTSGAPVKAIAEGFLSAAKDAGLSPGCSSCHQPVHAPAALVGDGIVGLCDPCFGTLETSSTQARLEREGGAVGAARGFLGALVGALLGSILWILIGYLGFYAGIAGFAIAWAATRGYRIAKGTLTRAAPVAIGAAVLVAVLFGEATGVALQVLKAVAKQGSTTDLLTAYRILPRLLAEADVRSEVLLNLCIGLVFAVLGSWRTLRAVFVQASLPLVEVRRV